MNILTKFLRDALGVAYAPITIPSAVRWPDGSNLNDKLSAFDSVVIETPVNSTDATLPITSLTCETGKYYRLDVPVETLAVALPAMAADVTAAKTVLIYLTAGTTPAITISSSDSKDVYYQDGYEIKAGKTYEVNCLYNGAAWVVGTLTINIGE